jgi:hypothetical protein
MTEYVVKEIGRLWIVYADRVSIAACVDEKSALKLIAEDSAAKSVMRRSAALLVGENPPRNQVASASPLPPRAPAGVGCNGYSLLTPPRAAFET